MNHRINITGILSNKLMAYTSRSTSLPAPHGTKPTSIMLADYYGYGGWVCILMKPDPGSYLGPRKWMYI